MPRVASNGLELHYEEQGEGPPLVLIMGIGAQLVLWPDDLVHRLADGGFRVIRFDNRDVGLSTWLDHLPVPHGGKAISRALIGVKVPAPYDLWDMADDTAGLLDALDLPDAHFLGVSMGGMVGQCLAVRHPDRVRSFTSMMSTTGKRRVSVGSPRALSALVGARPRTRDEIIDYFVNYIRTVSGSGYPVDLDEARRVAGLLYDRAHHPAGFARHWAAILATGDRTRHLAQVRAPTLVLHGEEDPLIPIAGGRATAAAVPGARFAPIPGMGHSLPRGALPLIADHILGHLRAAEGRAAPGVAG